MREAAARRSQRGGRSTLAADDTTMLAAQDEGHPTRRSLRAQQGTRRSVVGGRPPSRWRRARWAIAAVLAVGLVGLGVAYANLSGNIDTIDLIDSVGTDRPTAVVEGPLNILVMGSDTREGIGTTEYGTDTIEGGAHSDTNLLVHLSADRSRAMVVSIPRDSMVPAPEDCNDLSSTVENGAVRQWNLNFNQGGAPCVIRTLEGNTDIRIDHFIVIDFAGFTRMVDALGGIEVCLPEDVSDRDAQFELAAGRHVLDGKQALGYVRVRKQIGDGSDLGRIGRQQAFMSSVAQKATSTSLLLRPDRLYSFLDAATESMTTDSELSTTELARIANSVRSIGLSKVEFVTVPTEVYPEDPNRVQWTEEADLLWEAIRYDRPLTPDEPAPTGTATASSTTPSEPLTVTPDQISVSIVNASGVSGLSAQTARALAVQGFVTMLGGNQPVGEVTGTLIRHSAENAEAARTVQAAFPGSQLVEDATAVGSIVVQMGPGAINPVEVPNRLGFEPLPPMPASAEALGTSGTATSGISVRTADEDICS
jgi:LCP family protein required for cell wall assembly